MPGWFSEDINLLAGWSRSEDKMKKYEMQLTEREYKRLQSFMIVLSRVLDIYDQHPDMEITIRVKPKKWWRIW